MQLQPLTLEEGREQANHIITQVGPDQVCEFMIDWLDAKREPEALTEFQAELRATLEALLTKHYGERV